MNKRNAFYVQSGGRTGKDECPVNIRPGERQTREGLAGFMRQGGKAGINKYEQT
ncbi:MAG: hypothetical protein HY356_04495 [Gammaproteobacteria bacterium]|nr:hypothetical protein [Gammaproteobacteria bacterium]